MQELELLTKIYLYPFCQIITEVFLSFISATYNADVEDPYPSLSDFHDYEPNLEFDDSDLLQQKHPENDDGMIFFCFISQIILKFMFSKKATKIDEIFTIDLTLCFNSL